MTLAKAFIDMNSRLYVVGGWVRNNFCGLTLSDIDICGSLHENEVEKACTTCGFSCKVVNAKLGTYLIIAGDEKYEYTPFRIENYHLGKHSPENVSWTDDIKIDARRRDFTANAVYYDIIDDKIIDFYGGVADIERGVLRAIETPEYVFSSDGLRVLRLVRFACQLDWKIERKTLNVAKKMVYQLKYISGERKSAELKQIFSAAQKYDRHSRPIKILNNLNIYPYLVDVYGLPKKLDEKKYGKIVCCDDSLGALIAALILTKYNSRASEEQILFDTQNALSSLRCGGDVKDLARAICVMMAVRADDITLDVVCKFVMLKGESRQIVREFCGLEKLLEKERLYREQNIPLKIEQLDIENADIMALVPNDRVSYVKKYLFELCQNGMIKNNKQDLIQFLKRTSDYANKQKSADIQKTSSKARKSK